MLISVSLLILCTVMAIILFRLISQKKVASISNLAKRKKSLESKYDYLLGQKLEYKSELSQKKKQLATLINNQEGLRIKTAAQMNISKEDEEEMISTYLLASGKISLEQDHKIRQKKDVLRMGYLATGVTLGFIDLQTSTKLKQGNWAGKQ